ncbi:MAG: YraN family protein [Clostridia bacterium]|nr:YraN family protein [Clostridia bacterium]
MNKTEPRLVPSEIGRAGEDEAVKYLKKKKYKIIDRNVREGKSEIDIIALYGDTLVFVEVKSAVRPKEMTYLSRPADAVNKSKMTYLIRGAQKFCRDDPTKYSVFYKRFDVIEVYFEINGGKFSVSDIKHFENAFGRS